MKKAIRCCISCILPCGALDVIRIVHANGRVEEISGSVRACEVMKAYPKHVLKKPTSSMEWSSGGGGGESEMRRIVILSPDAQLERGKIYFLMPVPVLAPPLPSIKSVRRRRRSGRNQQGSDEVVESKHHHRRSGGNQQGGDEVLVSAESKHHRMSSDGSSTISLSLLSLSPDQYLSEILSEKLSTQRERKRGRVGVWRPNLESICESPGDTQL